MSAIIRISRNLRQHWEYAKEVSFWDFPSNRKSVEEGTRLYF
ncbi:hypothetical protein AAEX63_16030 [Luteococcus sp. H138]